MRRSVSKYMSKFSRLLFLIILLCIFTFIFSYLHSSVLNLNSLRLQEASKELAKSQLIKLMEQDREPLFVNFGIITISILLKVLVITFVLFVGFFLHNRKISFIRLLRLVIMLEFIFILPIIYEIIYFKFININSSLDDVRYFYPLSALNVVGYKGLEPWLIYPLQTLNLFELAYIIYLSFQIGKLTQTNADTGLKIVGYSYVPALILWVCVVMFLTLNYS